jgi:hypothetical protein
MMSCVSLIEFGNKHKQLLVTDRQKHTYRVFYCSARIRSTTHALTILCSLTFSRTVHN